MNHWANCNNDTVQIKLMNQHGQMILFSILGDSSKVYALK